MRENRLKIKEKIREGATFLLVEKLLSFLIGLVQLIVVVRYIKESDLGLMALTNSMLMFAHFFSELGLGNSILYKKETSVQQLSSLYWWLVFVGVGITSVLVLLSEPLVFFFKLPRLGLVIRVVAITIFINSFALLYHSILYKSFYFRLLSSINIFIQLTQAIVVCFLAIMGYGVWALVIGVLWYSLTKTVLLVVIGCRKFKPELCFRFQEIKEHIHFGIYQTGERLVTIIHQQADTFIISKLLGVEVLGIYDALKKILIKPLRILNSIITTFMLPLLAKFQNRTRLVEKLYLGQITYVSLLNFAVYICIILNLEIVFTYLLKAEWLTPTYYWVAVYFCIYCMIGSILNPMGTLIISHGRVKESFMYNILIAIVVPFLVFFSIYIYASVVVAVMMLMLVQLLAVFVTYYWILQPILKNKFKDYIASFGYPLLYACLSFGASSIILSIIGLPMIIHTPILCIAGTITYIGLIYYFDRPILDKIRMFVLGV